MDEAKAAVLDSPGEHYDNAKILKQIKAEGSDNFPDSSIECFIVLKSHLSRNVTQAFLEIHFTLIAGQARISAKSFKAIAGLDVRRPYAKVCGLMFWYDRRRRQIISLIANDPEQGVNKCSVATKIPEEIIKTLQTDPDFVQETEIFIKRMLKHYHCAETLSPRSVDVGKKLIATGTMLVDVGRLLFHTAEVMSSALESIEDNYWHGHGALQGNRRNYQ